MDIGVPKRLIASRPALLWTAIFTFICGWFAWGHLAFFAIIQDDTFISLRYARNLVEGYGLVFNVGEQVEGYTNYLYTLLLAGIMQAGWNAVPATLLFGLAFGLLSMVVTVRLARQMGNADWARWGNLELVAAP